MIALHRQSTRAYSRLEIISKNFSTRNLEIAIGQLLSLSVCGYLYGHSYGYQCARINRGKCNLVIEKDVFTLESMV